MILTTEIVLLVLAIGCVSHMRALSSPRVSAINESVGLALLAHTRRQQIAMTILALSCLAALVALEVWS